MHHRRRRHTAHSARLSAYLLDVSAAYSYTRRILGLLGNDYFVAPRWAYLELAEV